MDQHVKLMAKFKSIWPLLDERTRRITAANEALVELEMDSNRFFFFRGPKGGGVEVMHAKVEVTIITPDSPIGLNLLGKTTNQTWSAKIGPAQVKYRVVSVV
ncbi:MAG: hypothetical protein NTX27_20085 [Verrucomicrobia bacterium]|nr:hypothetical protein [Verrucomicrobiota bacterium]